MGDRIATNARAAYVDRMRNRFIGIGICIIAVTAEACSTTTKECTLIACQDQFSAAVRRTDGSFPSGMHRIEILADSVDVMCTFAYPLGTVPGGGAASPNCPSGLDVSVGQDEVCTEMTVNGGASLTCEPVPGRYAETIQLVGTPAQVHAWQYVDGAAILDITAAPSYQSVAPNGSECGPICRQASVAWTLN
jgi:hypothetical protein